MKAKARSYILSVFVVGAVLPVGDLWAGPGGPLQQAVVGRPSRYGAGKATLFARKDPGARFQRQFDWLQSQMRRRGQLYDWSKARDIIVVPALSLDKQELKKIPGYQHYEERMLFTLAHLAHPQTRVTFVSTLKIDPAIVDYYLSKLPDPVGARQRLRMIHLYDNVADASVDRPFDWLSERLNRRPEVRRRILDGVDRGKAHLYPFAVTDAEKRLAVNLGVPILGSDPKLAFYGAKDGCRQTAVEAGVPLPPGTNKRVHREGKLIDAIERFVTRYPAAEALMVKLTESFSGEGNAKFDLKGLAALPHSERRREIAKRLPKMKFMAGDGSSWEHFRGQMKAVGAIIELFMPGVIDSPSVQGYIGPDGKVEILSTFTQVLDGQEYMGGISPADPKHLAQLHKTGLAIGRVLKNKGALGRYAVDLVVTDCPDCGERGLPGRGAYYIETNLRLGGTTHSVNALRLFSATPNAYSDYDPKSGAIVSARSGRGLFHKVTDRLNKEIGRDALRGLTPAQVVGLIKAAGLDWNPKTEEGIILHLMGALREHGNAGFTAAAPSERKAAEIYRRALEVLANEGPKLTRQ